MEEINKKRQLVINFYEIVTKNIYCKEYQWIPTDWLLNWLKGTKKMTDTVKRVLPIDGSSLMCPHKKLDPLKANKAKFIPSKAADLLSFNYGNLYTLTDDSLCYKCVEKQCRKLRFKENLEKDYKEVTEILKNMKKL